MIRVEEILDWLERPEIRATTPEPVRGRGPTDHVIILDGTLSTLDAGQETNAGQTFRLLDEARKGHRLSLYYEPGLQWQGWRQPGDRIFLFGYSRGAYAVRSLAGLIDRMGLIRREEATERAILLLYRHYQTSPDSPAARRLVRRLCHPGVAIEMVGVWDTVKALGLQLPVLWKFTEVPHRFHNHHLGRAIRRGFHALALDETRTVFEPVLWDSRPEWSGHVEQVWFRGAHGDVGGQIGGFQPARPLANIPLVWMLERAEACGLPLPEDWRARLPCDAAAPMVGTWMAWGKLFLRRRRRVVGRDASESLHPTAATRQGAAPRWHPRPGTG